MPELRGSYLYSDHFRAFIRSLPIVDDGAGRHAVEDLSDHTRDLNPGGAISLVTSFGSDAIDEPYLCRRNGQLRTIVPTCHEGIDRDTRVGVADLLARSQTTVWKGRSKLELGGGAPCSADPSRR